jgi:hypothetical protein
LLSSTAKAIGGFYDLSPFIRANTTVAMFLLYFASCDPSVPATVYSFCHMIPQVLVTWAFLVDEVPQTDDFI